MSTDGEETLVIPDDDSGEPAETTEDAEMAKWDDKWEHSAAIAGDSAQMARDNHVTYSEDARRGYQRRIDTVSSTEAFAMQRASTSAAASEAMQLRLPTISPTVQAIE